MYPLTCMLLSTLIIHLYIILTHSSLHVFPSHVFKTLPPLRFFSSTSYFPKCSCLPNPSTSSPLYEASFPTTVHPYHASVPLMHTHYSRLSFIFPSSSLHHFPSIPHYLSIHGSSFFAFHHVTCSPFLKHPFLLHTLPVPPC